MKSLFIDALDLPSAQSMLISDGPIMIMPSTDRALAERAVKLACSRSQADGLMVAVMDTQSLFCERVEQVLPSLAQPLVGLLGARRLCRTRLDGTGLAGLAGQIGRLAGLQ